MAPLIRLISRRSLCIYRVYRPISSQLRSQTLLRMRRLFAFKNRTLWRGGSIPILIFCFHEMVTGPYLALGAWRSRESDCSPREEMPTWTAVSMFNPCIIQREETFVVVISKRIIRRPLDTKLTGNARSDKTDRFWDLANKEDPVYRGKFWDLTALAVC